MHRKIIVILSTLGSRDNIQHIINMLLLASYIHRWNSVDKYVIVHSLYSDHLVPTPILKPVRTQFSSFVRKITNVWHALQNSSCPKSPQKGERKRNFKELQHKAFSVSAKHAREVRNLGTRHKGQFQLVQGTGNKLYL